VDIAFRHISFEGAKANITSLTAEASYGHHRLTRRRLKRRRRGAGLVVSGVSHAWKGVRRRVWRVYGRQRHGG
jgi:hypothetical protein